MMDRPPPFRGRYFSISPQGCDVRIENVVDLYPPCGIRCIWYHRGRPYFFLKNNRLLCIVPVGGHGTYAKEAELNDPLFILEMIQTVVGSLDARRDTVVFLATMRGGDLQPQYLTQTLRLPLPEHAFELGPVIDEQDITPVKWATPSRYVGTWKNIVVEVRVFTWTCSSEQGDQRYWTDVLKQYAMVARKGVAHLFPKFIAHVSHNNRQVGFMIQSEVSWRLMDSDKPLAMAALQTVENKNLLCIGLKKGLDHMTLKMTSRGCIFNDVREVQEVLPGEITDGGQQYHRKALDASIIHNKRILEVEPTYGNFPTLTAAKPLDLVLSSVPQVPYSLTYDQQLLEEHTRRKLFFEPYHAIQAAKPKIEDSTYLSSRTLRMAISCPPQAPPISTDLPIAPNSLGFRRTVEHRGRCYCRKTGH